MAIQPTKTYTYFKYKPNKETIFSVVLPVDSKLSEADEIVLKLYDIDVTKRKDMG